MATQANPLITSLIPGANPAGQSIGVPYGGGGTSNANNPMMPAVPSGPSAPAMPYSSGGFSAYASPYNPIVAPSVPSIGSAGGPSAPTIPGGLQSSGAPGAPPSSPGTSLTPGQQTSLNTTLSKNYGSGIAGLIEQFLAGGAGFNQDAINKLLAAMQPQNEQNEQNLLTSFGSTGNRFSSGAQIGEAALGAQESLNAGQIEASMYEQSVNDYLSTLMGVAGTSASRIENSPSTWDQIGSALSLTSDVSGGLSQLAPNNPALAALSNL